jgi:glycosyltransferase involved in cell wall biosynthesis
VIIPTKNSAGTLETCLESIVEQTYKKIEVIIIDNCSVDRTRQIAEKFGAKFYHLRKERSPSLNYGVTRACGKYIYRVDGDYVLEPLVVEEAVGLCENEGYDALVIHNTSDSTISFWSEVRKLERDCVKGDELNVAARFFRKDVFEKVGGYNKDLVAAEDYDLHNRLVKKHFRIGRTNACEVHIGEPRTLADIIRKYYYYGKTIEKFIKNNPNRGMKQLSPIRPAHIRNWKLFMENPVLSAGFVIYQTSRYLSASIGYLAAKVR